MSDSSLRESRIHWVTESVTGGTAIDATSTANTIITYPFGRYEIKVVVSPSNEFVGIQEISVRKDFRSYEQRAAEVRVHDVEEFYKE